MQQIRRARPDEWEMLAAVAAAADTLFDTVGIRPLPPSAGAPAFAAAHAVLACGDPPVGFAMLEVVDGSAFLDQLSVHPDHTRQGLGAALLEAACAWAAAEGFAAITLTTFADVPWNGPFYTRHGFAPVTGELPAGLRRIRDREIAIGLDAFGPRFAMRKPL
ncbi:GNAT family N-acetyltransferase [Longispora sp. K20-0274]|uniref:GNAT family N-acetyltransferase n=1 Tax=Longispora sp. K20-0274 TaxID=3088255 RepID=UPI00399A1C21